MTAANAADDVRWRVSDLATVCIACEVA